MNLVKRACVLDYIIIGCVYLILTCDEKEYKLIISRIIISGINWQSAWNDSDTTTSS